MRGPYGANTPAMALTVAAEETLPSHMRLDGASQSARGSEPPSGKAVAGASISLLTAVRPSDPSLSVYERHCASDHSDAP